MLQNYRPLPRGRKGAPQYAQGAKNGCEKRSVFILFEYQIFRRGGIFFAEKLCTCKKGKVVWKKTSKKHALGSPKL